MSYLGFWFDLLKEHGESIDIRLGEINTSHSPDFKCYPHNKFDGLSALKSFSNESYNFDLDLKKAKLTNRRKGFKRFIGLLDYQINRKLPHLSWKCRNFEKGRVFSSSDKPIFYLTFRKDELQEIKELDQFSKNSFFLFHINQFLNKNLSNIHDSYVMWMLPVSLRGHINDPNALDNQASYIDILINDSDSLDKLSQNLKKVLSSGRYWDVFEGASFIAKYFPKQASKVVKDHLENGGPPYFGCFSNLGSWYIPGSKGIVLSANVTSVRPVGVGMLEVNDILTLSIQLHETIKVPSDFEKKLLEFKDFLLRKH